MNEGRVNEMDFDFFSFSGIFDIALDLESVTVDYSSNLKNGL